jgi:phosphohistidine phosphatase
LRLLIVRHAIAKEVAPGGGDRERPLSAEGRTKMRVAARGLRLLVPALGTIAASPLRRATATAELLSEAFADLPIEVVEPLAPGADYRALLPWLDRRWREQTDVTVAVVGHQPGLGELASWLLAPSAHSFLEFKKGGAALLDFGDSAPRAGAAYLCWLLEPAHLRSLGEAGRS